MKRCVSYDDTVFKNYFKTMRPANWSSGNTFVYGAGGPRLKSRASQFERGVTKGSTPLRDISSKLVGCQGAMTRRRAPPTRYRLLRNIVSIMKDWILVFVKSAVLGTASFF